MRGYVATCRGPVANPRTIGRIGHDASAGQRGYLEHFIVSASGTPADNAIIWTLQRTTTTGTTTAVTPASIGDPSAAADLVAGENATAEPTYTASTELFDNAVNQRATFMVVFPDLRRPVIAATANAGLGMKASHASFTGNAEVSLSWAE